MLGRPRHYNVRTRFELTARQREVLDLVARGRTNGEIALELGITLDGVKWHVREILAKFQVESREDAADLWKREQSGANRVRRALAGLPVGLLRWAAASACVAVVGGVTAVALYAFGDGDASTASAQPEIASCDPAQISVDVVASDDVSGRVAIDTTVRNAGPTCIDDGFSVAVRLSRDPDSPDIARMSVMDAFPRPGTTTPGRVEWQDYCGAPGPFTITVRTGNVTAETVHELSPACEGGGDGSSVLVYPVLAGSQARACGAVPPLVMSTEDAADGRILIHVHVPAAGCHLPDSDAIVIYSAERPQGTAGLAILAGGVETGESDVTYAWRNGCDTTGPFEVHASMQGAQGSLTIDHAPRCEASGSSHDGTIERIVP